MDKSQVEALDDEKNQVSTMTTVPPVESGKETEDTCAESGRYRLPDEYVRSILAMTRTPPREDMRILQTPNLAELLGVTEESLEEDRKRFYGEAAARSKRINDGLELFQDKVRKEWERQGYVEVDDEYLDNLAKMQAYDKELWKDYDWTGFEFSDPDDPDYACWYQ